ncbi:MAG: DmsE family decaheme c-type cytochrome [Betaproteobacteria bacterium]|nr:DmsE family decaheme c-type cytochrome [Betaproteobacteria bacterium]
MADGTAGWARGALLILAGLALSATTAALAIAQDKEGYIGEARCATCHKLEQEHWAHTAHAKVFRVNPGNALATRGCEACHGPGAKHLQDATDKTAIIAFTHRRGTPVETQNAQCLQCHKGRQRIFWQGSVHQTSQLSCSDCHNPMAKFSVSGLLAKGSISETCFTCHQQQRTEFRKRSHMPLPEGRMSCGDCHNPHGSVTRPLIKADTVNQLCYACHSEKRGPFIWEHAPVRRDCLSCHTAHGSSHESLLVVARPFLCQQCHANISHPANLLTRSNLPRGAWPDERAVNRSCSNCHSQIHGSNHPSGARFQR